VARLVDGLFASPSPFTSKTLTLLQVQHINLPQTYMTTSIFEVHMKNHIPFLAALIITLSIAASLLADTNRYDVDMTIRQIAHDVGLKGRELAESLGLEGSVDKDTALLKLGISQRQLEEALERIPHPEPGKEEEHVDINIGMTLSEAAHAMGITGKELAHDLNLPVDANKETPLKELGVKEAVLAEAVKHAAHEKGGALKWLKYPVWVLICGLAIFLLMSGRASKLLYLSTLTASLIATGFLFGKSPNPMEGTVKLFKAAVGIFPDPAGIIAAFIFFCALAVIGNKLICGWGCPFGALQELLFETPMGNRVKQLREKKLPFLATSALRTLLFGIFVLFIFGLLGSKKGFVIYHYINPFNLFSFEFTLLPVVISVILFILVSPFIYRSFCQLICPFGVISWLLEKISLTRVQINGDNCTQCMACVKACPLEAMKGRMDDKTWPADCFSCARCLRSCDYDALDYAPVWGKGSVKSEAGKDPGI
jgi:ferredoxin